MSLPSDVTINNLKDFYAMILPYLNVGNGGTSDTPLGQVAFFDDVVAPAGWLIADGTVYNISDYPDLANQYERVHGSKNFYGGNGTTTFAVPDLQGEFLRASGTNSHTNQGSGAAVGVHQDATEHLNLRINQRTNDVSINGVSGDSMHGANNIDSGTVGTTAHWTDKGGSSSGDGDNMYYTSRPTNTSLLCCVKAVPSSEMNTYSTTERRVGTWIDGKPLYQKTIAVTVPTSGSSSVSLPANVRRVVYMYGYAYSSTYDETLTLPRVNTSNASYCVEVRVSGNSLTVYASADHKLDEAYVTLRYTKTTD